jgi:signal transduction histidine kinase
MRISSKLWFAECVPLLVAFVIGAGLIYSYLVFGTAQKEGDKVRLIRNSVNEMNQLIFSYVTYREERPKQQFLAEQEKLNALLASLHFQDQNQQQLLNEIKANNKFTKEAFLSLIFNTEQLGRAGTDPFLTYAEGRLSGQLLIRGRTTDSLASTLQNLVDADIYRAQVRIIPFIFLIMFLAAIPFTFLLYQIRKKIALELTTLRNGTEIISAGNLDHFISAKANDEIGELTQSFNRMTANLKEVTASRVDLEREIAERKQAEEELKKAHDQLEIRVQERTAELSTTVASLGQVNRELEEFAFIASHDLQEPLRKIETFSDMVKKRCASLLDKTSRDYLDRVIKSAGHMRLLIGDLLKLSRITTERKPFQGIDLFGIAKEVTEVFEAPLEKTGGRIEIDKMPVIEADETQLRQLFQNLIGNALKFRDQNKPLIQVYGQVADHGFYEIFVKDNGIGFDPGFAERIFIPFERLHGRSKYEGTGMGLAICRKIVERHGGTIRAESEPGKGSTFIIKLPLKQIEMEEK